MGFFFLKMFKTILEINIVLSVYIFPCIFMVLFLKCNTKTIKSQSTEMWIDQALDQAFVCSIFQAARQCDKKENETKS